MKERAFCERTLRALDLITAIGLMKDVKSKGTNWFGVGTENLKEVRHISESWAHIHKRQLDPEPISQYSVCLKVGFLKIRNGNIIIELPFVTHDALSLYTIDPQHVYIWVQPWLLTPSAQFNKV